MEDLKYLELLSEKYPTVQAACTEIINLSAILNLPKGTEHFISDIHGEDEAFCHILNNASGVIKEKVDDLFSKTMDMRSRTELCTLIYYPERKLKDIKRQFSGDKSELKEWYMITLYRLIEVCRLCSSKYTRSKVRKAFPKDFEYILDELLNVNNESENKQLYYEQIINSIIEIGRADAFISALAKVIKRLCVDRLHIVGDIYDRGPHADVILDRLIEHHSVDIVWGNHDILWMGAASGSSACVAAVLNNSTKYKNLDLIENSYGINMRPLALFAEQTYDSLKSNTDAMHKAVAVIQFKLEGQTIKRHPEYKMDDRLVLNNINFGDMTVTIDGKVCELNDKDLPTIDPEDPYKLTEAEEMLARQLTDAFMHSEKLNRHVRFLYSQGSLYKVYNGNLMFHGCIPMEEDGTLHIYETDEGARLKGRELMDYADKAARKAYLSTPDDPDKTRWTDFMWYLWCGSYSPLFGRDKMRTFERMFIDDKEVHAEIKNPYYALIEDEEVCLAILEEFGLNGSFTHIINGHVPVLAKEGEAPVRGGGRLIMIDGGFCRAYQAKTGIAGYTMFFSSHGIKLVSHEPFCGIADAIARNKDIISAYVVFDATDKRLTVKDTDNGAELKAYISDLTELLNAYRSGLIKEKG